MTYAINLKDTPFFTYVTSYHPQPVPSTTLTECQTYPVVVQSTDPTNAESRGHPPYYIIALPSSGIPTTSPVGPAPTNLHYTVNQPAGLNEHVVHAFKLTQSAGSQLTLVLIDSRGEVGSAQPAIYNVTCQYCVFVSRMPSHLY